MRSCTIITTAPNAKKACIQKRMPVIQGTGGRGLCSSTRPSKTPPPWCPCSIPYPADVMEAYAVSRSVNAPTMDDPGLIAPVSSGGF